MSESARVNSIEAVRDFRIGLTSFCEDVRQALATVDMEARRVLDWIARDQQGYWTRMVRQCQEEVTQAKADLFRRQLSKMSGDNPDVTEQRDALRRAQARLEHAEEKIEKCRRWERQLQRPLEEYRAPAMHLGSMVEGDPPRIVTVLDRVLDSLDSYLAAMPPPSVSRPRPISSPAEPAPAPAAPSSVPTAETLADSGEPAP